MAHLLTGIKTDSKVVDMFIQRHHRQQQAALLIGAHRDSIIVDRHSQLLTGIQTESRIVYMFTHRQQYR